jgi:serine protease AprX
MKNITFLVLAVVLCLTVLGAHKSSSFQTIQPIKSVKEFDDVRWKDLSKLNLSGKPGILRTLRFNEKTIWPKPARMAAGDSPEKLLKKMMNPGLGVCKLHEEGITGKGVNVAIIDQPLYQDHPEFAGKITAYHDMGCGSESSMHGPAVASLLVGTNCGTAPDARVYYVAAPSWTKDTAYQAKALDWIVEQNERLPVSEKIRVVSVSAAPSGPGSPFEKNQEMWDQAYARAEAAGILVLDCTSHHGFIGKCWYNARVPESVSACTPGDPRYSYHTTDHLLVPSAPRTTAEEYDKGDCSYQYCGTGGLSWSIPYCAGVLALGWQLRPDISPERMRELLFKSAYTKKDGTKIINPGRFIRFVKAAKSGGVSKDRRKVSNY